MIVTEFYNGQGLGNQLACYVMTRVIAHDHGYTFGIMHPERFKGATFLSLDFGLPVIGGTIPYEGAPPSTLPRGIEQYYCEKNLTLPDGTDIRSYDNTMTILGDNTKIDGIFQGEKYFKHHKEEIRQWLHIIPNTPDQHLCIINFRGGEYVGGEALFLPQSYWDHAIANMRTLNPSLCFRVVTDDVKTAKKFFPHFTISHNLSEDYRAIQSAFYLILSNSSFALFPAWLNENAKMIIAPKYWARHNISDGYWSCGYNIVEGWMYQDRTGRLQGYDECVKDMEAYTNNHFRDTTPATIVPRTFRRRIARFLPYSIKRILKKIIR